MPSGSGRLILAVFRVNVDVQYSDFGLLKTETVKLYKKTEAGGFSIVNYGQIQRVKVN